MEISLAKLRSELEKILGERVTEVLLLELRDSFHWEQEKDIEFREVELALTKVLGAPGQKIADVILRGMAH